jgi:hypothetical protein
VARCGGRTRAFASAGPLGSVAGGLCGSGDVGWRIAVDVSLDVSRADQQNVSPPICISADFRTLLGEVPVHRLNA